jgi:hypothetical protein
MVKSGKPTPDDKIEIHGDVFDQVRILYITYMNPLDYCDWQNNEQD